MLHLYLDQFVRCYSVDVISILMKKQTLHWEKFLELNLPSRITSCERSDVVSFLYVSLEQTGLVSPWIGSLNLRSVSCSNVDKYRKDPTLKTERSANSKSSSFARLACQIALKSVFWCTIKEQKRSYHVTSQSNSQPDWDESTFPRFADHLKQSYRVTLLSDSS